MISLAPDVLGLLFVSIAFLLLAVSHRATYRDPYSNFLTQLIDGWYSNWHEPPERRRGLLRVASTVYFILVAVFAAGAAVAFLRGS